jgi:endonuclease-3
VRRLSLRLGLTVYDDPAKIEPELMEIIPKEKWMKLTDLLIFHGRQVCIARRPKCEACVLNKICPCAFSFS